MGKMGPTKRESVLTPFQGLEIGHGRRRRLRCRGPKQQEKEEEEPRLVSVPSFCAGISPGLISVEFFPLPPPGKTWHTLQLRFGNRTQQLSAV